MTRRRSRQTDAPYFNSAEYAFHLGADFALKAARWYSPETRIEKCVVFGDPTPDRISTCYFERST